MEVLKSITGIVHYLMNAVTCFLKIRTNVRMEKADVTPMLIVRTLLDPIVVNVKQVLAVMDFHVQVSTAVV